jgi:SPP1 family predicted phage head-tail adaptor
MSGETIQIIRRSETASTDAYGQPTYNETTITVGGVAVALKGQNVAYQAGEQLETDQITLFLPAGTDITNNDTVMVRGVEYLINGEAFNWVSPTSAWNPGLQLDLKRKDNLDGR